MSLSRGLEYELLIRSPVLGKSTVHLDSRTGVRRTVHLYFSSGSTSPLREPLNSDDFQPVFDPPHFLRLLSTWVILYSEFHPRGTRPGLTKGWTGHPFLLHLTRHTSP